MHLPVAGFSRKTSVGFIVGKNLSLFCYFGIFVFCFLYLFRAGSDASVITFCKQKVIGEVIGKGAAAEVHKVQCGSWFCFVFLHFSARTLNLVFARPNERL